MDVIEESGQKLLISYTVCSIVIAVSECFSGVYTNKAHYYNPQITQSLSQYEHLNPRFKSLEFITFILAPFKKEKKKKITIASVNLVSSGLRINTYKTESEMQIYQSWKGM